MTDGGVAPPPSPQVGYQIRLDRAASNKTQLLFCTTGILSRRRDCHFVDIPYPSLLKRLLKEEGGAAE